MHLPSIGGSMRSLASIHWLSWAAAVCLALTSSTGAPLYKLTKCSLVNFELWDSPQYITA